MNITSIYYIFETGKIIVKEPLEIIKETENCYFVNKGRYLKYEIDVVQHKSRTQYGYLELVMIDADEKTLREKLSEWFVNEANRITNNF